jgi:hypothetical protein
MLQEILGIGRRYRRKVGKASLSGGSSAIYLMKLLMYYTNI